MKVNYNQIRELIASRQSFKGNSCRAVKTDESYTIYSYAIIIYKQDYTNTSEPPYFNIDYYSSTTSKLQNIIAQVIYGKSLKEFRANLKPKDKPYIARCDKDKGVFKAPILQDIPQGWKVVNTYFVDNSGFGAEDELALTASQFLNKVIKDRAYCITKVGKFQVYVNELVRI